LKPEFGLGLRQEVSADFFARILKLVVWISDVLVRGFVLLDMVLVV
jgi:hypothetical protein